MGSELIDGDDELLLAEEVARIFKVHSSTVSRWAAAGRVESIRTPGGRQRRYRRSEIEKLLKGSEGNDGNQA